MELIEASGGGYDLGHEARWAWMAEHLGPLGVGFQIVETVYLFQPLSLTEFESLRVLNEIERLQLVTRRVTPDWIEALGSFSHLQTLRIQGEITADDVHQLLEDIPTLEVLRIDRITEGEHIAFEDLSQGGSESQAYPDCRGVQTFAHD